MYFPSFYLHLLLQSQTKVLHKLPWNKHNSFFLMFMAPKHVQILVLMCLVTGLCNHLTALPDFKSQQTHAVNRRRLNVNIGTKAEHGIYVEGWKKLEYH